VLEGAGSTAANPALCSTACAAQQLEARAHFKTKTGRPQCPLPPAIEALGRGNNGLVDAFELFEPKTLARDVRHASYPSHSA